MTPNAQASGQIALILGTRPEIIKLARVASLLGERAVIIHTGQHYDAELSEQFLRECHMPTPSHHLGVGGGTRAEQVGSITIALGDLFQVLQPAAVVVQGDTSSALGGALAANASDTPLVHIEAGLRSFDRRMPEEHNRVVIDHLSDLCLAPTAENVRNLANESILAERVELTGNPVVDAVHRIVPSSQVCHAIADKLGVDTSMFVLATIHRPENVDNPERLTRILDALSALPVKTVLPIHPRTMTRVREFELERMLSRLHVVPPLGYGEFLGLMSLAALIVSDSGGIQEEVSVLRRPTVNLRRSTERPEVEGTFVRRVEPSNGLTAMLLDEFDDRRAWTQSIEGLPTPYGDDDSPRKIVKAIDRFLS